MASTWLTPTEVAERLGVSRATAHRLIKSGVVPAIVLTSGVRRRLIRVREQALERAMKDRECRAALRSATKSSA